MQLNLQTSSVLYKVVVKMVNLETTLLQYVINGIRMASTELVLKYQETIRRTRFTIVKLSRKSRRK